MNYLSQIIYSLLNKYIGGQIYFTALDKSIQHPSIVYKLLSLIPNNSEIIVTGKFGNYVKNLCPYKDMILLKGGLRFDNKICLDFIANKIKNRGFTLIDDSYYSGKTRDVIRKELSRLNGDLINTCVVYDGSKWKDKKVMSLFRYHERF